MKTLLRPLLCLCIFLAIGHIYTLKTVPNFIMSKTMQAMEKRGVPLHEFYLSARTTPQGQTVVRPSPDLAYSICLYDFSLSNKALNVQAAVWDGYTSVSFFDSHTNNFATIRVEKTGKGSKTLLHPPRTDISNHIQSDIQNYVSPTSRGLILIRRLAPTAEHYSQVRVLSKKDLCASLPSKVSP